MKWVQLACGHWQKRRISYLRGNDEALCRQHGPQRIVLIREYKKPQIKGQGALF